MHDIRVVTDVSDVIVQSHYCTTAIYKSSKFIVVMKKIIVLGAGNMGAHIASCLTEEYKVTVADYSQISLDRIANKDIETVSADLSQPAVVKELVSGYDLVITALPEAFGYQALQAVIESGKNAVDISFWNQSEERISQLDALARENDVTIFIDSGVAPGFSNALVSYFDLLLAGKTKTAAVYVGGIPLSRERGFFAPWSVAGVIEEYTRQALHVKNGHMEKSPALSLIETLDSPVGKLDAGLTDGLRTLPFSLPHIQTMSEFTLRYPGHFHQMNILKEIGFFSDDPIAVKSSKITALEMTKLLDVDGNYRPVLEELGFYDNTVSYDCPGQQMAPRKVAIAVLANKWMMRADDRDILVMRVQADDAKTTHTADIYAEHNGINSAMALTTGSMAVLSAKALAKGMFNKKGSFPLEKVIREEPELIQYFISGLESLGVVYKQNKTVLK
ncbi:MAG: saccharopine dehydrogenase NADP-binding domain-containing protein [Candidatus Aenigmarchaeota archaeon]|nr:saccharopine dehydrogenase NADP-binding domain-containing protein [Candidatus Aenigmarchaeota archaeon]